MGVAELRDAFNSVAEPAGVSCARAFLSYEHEDGIQFQRLMFHGTDANGEQFEAISELVQPGGDIATAARDTATQLLAQSPAEPANENPS